MRKLFNEFFYIPKHGKIREKVMLARIVTSLTIVIMCLAAMSISAYAYFSCNVTSGYNTIKAANFEANVFINITDAKSNPVTVAKEGKIQTANLEAGKYTIELTKGNSTAHKGFCIVTIGNKTYYTDQIGVDVEKKLDNATVKFNLWLSAPAKIEVLSHWGTSVHYGYKDADRTEVFIVSGDTLDLTASATSGETDESEGSSDSPGETTTTPSTDTTSTETTTETQPATETTDVADAPTIEEG